MKGLLQRVTVATLALAAFACLDTTSPSSSVLSLSDALVTDVIERPVSRGAKEVGLGGALLR